MALLFDPADVELPMLEPGRTRVVPVAEEPEPEPEREPEPQTIEGWEATAPAPEASEVSHSLIDDEFVDLSPVETAAPESTDAPVPEAQAPVVEALFAAKPPEPVESAESAAPADSVEVAAPARPPAPVFVTASGKPSRSSRGLLTLLVLVVLVVAAYAFGLLDKLLELLR